MLMRYGDNSKDGARRNIEFHYDLGNDFYAAWLDESMTYSSAIVCRADFSDAETLEDALRHAKSMALLERLDLKAGDSSTRNRLRLGRVGGGGFAAADMSLAITA